jgi:flagellar basal body-associated protein FliL
LSRSTSRFKSSVDAASLDAQLLEIRLLLSEHSEQLAQQQQQFNALAGGFSNIAEVLKQIQNDSSTPEIQAINQNLDTLGKATVNTYKKLDKIDVNKNLINLESEQQRLCEALEAAEASLQSQSENLADYLDWKRTAVIIVITAIISSVSSLAIAHLVVSNQSDKKDQHPIQTEKPLNAKTKKAPKSK